MVMTADDWQTTVDRPPDARDELHQHDIPFRDRVVACSYCGRWGTVSWYGEHLLRSPVCKATTRAEMDAL